MLLHSHGTRIEYTDGAVLQPLTSLTHENNLTPF